MSTGKAKHYSVTQLTGTKNTGKQARSFQQTAYMTAKVSAKALLYKRAGKNLEHIQVHIYIVKYICVRAYVRACMYTYVQYYVCSDMHETKHE